MREHAKEVETTFVSIGNALHEQLRLSTSLVQQRQEFESFTSSVAETNPVRRAIALVGDTVRRLDALNEESHALLEQLRAQHDEIARLHQNGARLERAIAPLRIVETLFRIESAGLPPETQAAFSALTQQIAELDLRVRDTFSLHFNALGITRNAILQVVRHLDTQRAEHDRAAATQRAAIRNSLASLEDGIARLQPQAERTASLIRDVDREANAMVVGLQYQDITRQKLEHVESGLATLRERVASGRASRSYVSQSARLQAAQLSAVAGEQEQAVQSIAAGLHRIVAQLQGLESMTLHHGDQRSVRRNVEATIDTASEMLGSLGVAVERMDANGRAAMQAVAAFGTVASDLGCTIRELTWGIRLIALNAQVQAAQVARCDGLEVLARHTYIVSEETTRLTEAIGSDLGAIDAQLKLLAAQARSFGEHTATAAAEFAESRKLEGEISGQRTRVLRAVDEFSPLLSRAHEHVARLQASGLGQLDTFALTALQAELEALCTWCGESEEPANAGDAEQDFASLHQQYTMESERAIHEAALNSGPGKRPAVTSSPPSPAGATPVQKPAATSEAPKPEAAVELGNNVELF